MGVGTRLRAGQQAPEFRSPGRFPQVGVAGDAEVSSPGLMADSKLLVPELNEAETMGAETARFEELLLQVRLTGTSGSLGGFFSSEMVLQFPEGTREATGPMGIVVV